MPLFLAQYRVRQAVAGLELNITNLYKLNLVVQWVLLRVREVMVSNLDSEFVYSFFFNKQSEYKILYMLMGWLWVKLVDVLAWWGPLLRGDLVHRITVQLATVVPVFVRHCPLDWGGVVGSSEFLFVYGAWHFWRGWLLARLEYLGLHGSWHWWRTMGRQQFNSLILSDLAETSR